MLARIGQGRIVFNIKFGNENKKNKQHLYAFYTTTMVSTFIEYLSLDYPELHVTVSAPVSKENEATTNIIDDMID